MRLGHPPDARGVAARAQFMTAPKAEKFARKNPEMSNPNMVVWMGEKGNSLEWVK